MCAAAAHPWVRRRLRSYPEWLGSTRSGSRSRRPAYGSLAARRSKRSRNCSRSRPASSSSSAGRSRQVWLAEAGQQHSDNVLAPAAPIVGTTADRVGDTAFVKGDPHAVRFVLAALDLGLHHVAALYQGEHRTFPVIALTPAERLGRVCRRMAASLRDGIVIKSSPIARSGRHCAGAALTRDDGCAGRKSAPGVPQEEDCRL